MLDVIIPQASVGAVHESPLQTDQLMISQNSKEYVIPAKAGIQLNQVVLGSRLRGSDDFSYFLRDHQNSPH
jgi:hypothetical protein